MQFYTAIKMAQLIKRKGKTTAQELANEFELSVRTVMRYITELSLCFPIYTKRGPEGGIYWLKQQKEKNMKNLELIGKKMRIIEMQGEPQYTGKEGTVRHVDDAGQIHGTWGGCALLPDVDVFEIVGEPKA